MRQITWREASSELVGQPFSSATSVDLRARRRWLVAVLSWMAHRCEGVFTENDAADCKAVNAGWDHGFPEEWNDDAPLKRPVRVIIESPCSMFGGTSRNVYAEAAIADSLARGEAPFASHVLYTTVLDDGDEAQRRRGMQAGFAWGEAADLVAVYVDYGITPGMEEGASRAMRLGIPVEHRKLHHVELAAPPVLDRSARVDPPVDPWYRCRSCRKISSRSQIVRGSSQDRCPGCGAEERFDLVADDSPGVALPVDRSAVTTTSGREPTIPHGQGAAPEPIDPKTGQHGAYWVLTEAERAKGYQRPVRASYMHVGLPKAQRALEPVAGTTFRRCGNVTTMGGAIAETYAREPAFYSATFCVACQEHYPVGEAGEFVWVVDGRETAIKVGT